jgi:concentrative nucleoside transporter, CNT family
MLIARTLFGILLFCGLCWLLSTDRRRFPWRTVAWGLVMQFAIAALILGTQGGGRFFQWLTDVVTRLISMTEPGARMVFGSLADPTSSTGFVFAFAGQGLLAIIFFSTLMSILYHLGVMQVVVWVFARVMSAFMGVSGAESTAMAANVFLGQTEAPLVVKPYVPTMTVSELNSLMVGGFASIAGSVMAIYIGMLGAEYGPHLLAASVMSAPAAFVCAKIMVPETERAQTAGRVELRIERDAHNLIEAAANGTSDGLKLWLNVIAMLIAFTALVALVNWPLGWLGETLSIPGGLSLSSIFGYALAPLAWITGVDGWNDCRLFGSLMGTKIAINEFVAYDLMKDMLPGAGNGSGAVFEHARSAKMAAYALCGFANFASVGIQIGGIVPLAPARRTDIARLALRAMLAGALATWMMACVAGAFL